MIKLSLIIICFTMKSSRLFEQRRYIAWKPREREKQRHVVWEYNYQRKWINVNDPRSRILIATKKRRLAKSLCYFAPSALVAQRIEFIVRSASTR